MLLIFCESYKQEAFFPLTYSLVTLCDVQNRRNNNNWLYSCNS